MMNNDASRIKPVVLVLGDDEIERHREAWRSFDVSKCDCFNPEDKRRFLHVVEQHPGGAARFNRIIRHFGGEREASFFASRALCQDEGFIWSV
jgi:hypothetical protein